MRSLQFGSVGQSTKKPNKQAVMVREQRMRQPRSITSTEAKAVHSDRTPSSTIGQNASLCAAAAAPPANKPANSSTQRCDRKANPESTNKAARPPKTDVRTVLITARPPALSLLLEGRRRL